MSTVIHGDWPEVRAFIERRLKLGLDGDDFRVPDLGVHRGEPDGLYLPTAAIVVEILSPNAETFEKFDFYHRHGVEEILVADLDERSIRLWRTDGGSSHYGPADDSLILGTTVAGITAAVDWP